MKKYYLIKLESLRGGVQAVFFGGTVTSQSSIIYNKQTRCNSGSIVFIKNYKYALHVSDALCVHHQEHYKL